MSWDDLFARVNADYLLADIEMAAAMECDPGHDPE